jgi:hypothetical protein
MAAWFWQGHGRHGLFYPWSYHFGRDVAIVIKPDQEIDLVKKLDPGLYELIQIKLKKLKTNIWNFNILYKKIKKQFIWIYWKDICYPFKLKFLNQKGFFISH